MWLARYSHCADFVFQSIIISVRGAVSKVSLRWQETQSRMTWTMCITQVMLVPETWFWRLLCWLSRVFSPSDCCAEVSSPFWVVIKEIVIALVRTASYFVSARWPIYRELSAIGRRFLLRMEEDSKSAVKVKRMLESLECTSTPLGASLNKIFVKAWENVSHSAKPSSLFRSLPWRAVSDSSLFDSLSTWLKNVCTKYDNSTVNPTVCSNALISVITSKLDLA